MDRGPREQLQESEQAGSIWEAAERYQRKAYRTRQRLLERCRNETPEQEAVCRAIIAERTRETCSTDRAQRPEANLRPLLEPSTTMPGSAAGHEALVQEQKRANDGQQGGGQQLICSLPEFVGPERVENLMLEKKLKL